MKKIALKFTTALTTMMSVANVARASELETTLEAIQETVADLALPVGSFFIFVSVLMVGFSIVKNRDNAEERGKSMESLLWLAIGAFIIGGALIIGPAIWSVSQAQP